jgi:high affinity Mn2+ porin
LGSPTVADAAMSPATRSDDAWKRRFRYKKQVTNFRRRLSSVLAAVVGCLAWSTTARAQFNYENGQDTVFAHSETSPYWVSGQVNDIFQWNPRFSAPYNGPNSFEHASKAADTVVFTLYTGLQLTRDTEVLFDVESAGGSSLSDATGLAGFTNQDAQRNPNLGWTPYFARAEVHQLIPLSNDVQPAERNPLSLLTSLPARRIDIYAGEFSLVDYFDNNAVAGNDHMQFMNWSVVNTGTYDYAGETRGYTWGGVIDFVYDSWTFRFAEVLNSKKANGISLQKNLQDEHSENYELEYQPTLLAGRNTDLHFLTFTNFANMGSYHEANSLFLAGKTTTPDVNVHPPQVTLKYGFAVNAEQDFTEDLRGFVRAGWNEGQHQSWQYTETDETVAFGGDLRGTWWHRPSDKFGVAFVGNGISRDHREYLSLGGLGLNLGDGGLSYGAEKIMETYYNFPLPLYSGLYAALDIQYFDNPGYNRARGPVTVVGGRLHIEL